MAKNFSVFQWLYQFATSMKNKKIYNKKIFIWNDNFSMVNTLFEALIDKNQLKMLKTNPPVNFPAENLTWLGEFTKLGSNHKEITDNLIQNFSRAFTHIRLYHACCPMSLQSYYKKGFIQLDPEDVEKNFKEVFSPHASQENIRNAIQEGQNFIAEMTNLRHLEARKKIHFPIDKNFIDKECGVFMLGGEYLVFLVNSLTGIDTFNKQKILLQGRIPTVFIVDMPIKMIDENHLSWIARNIASKWVCIYLKKEEHNDLHGSISFSQVEPQYIHEHYHLKKIVTRNLDTELPMTLDLYCDKCCANKMISIVQNISGSFI